MCAFNMGKDMHLGIFASSFKTLMKLNISVRFPRDRRRNCTTAVSETATTAAPTTRYLILFQYFGTKYSGVVVAPPNQEVFGVLNYLEKATERLRPTTPIKFVVSSRTDSGVHALCNTAHIDIEKKPGKPPFSEDVLIKSFNRFLKSEPIRVLSVHRVPDTFHARFSALSRTYVYRVATGCSSPFEMPVFEQNLCWATCRGHFNLLAMREAAAVLEGTHDFSTFRSASDDQPFRSPWRTLMRAEVRPSSGFLMHHSQDSELRFWELEFQARSFLYKQVRRMAGVLVAVGQNRLQPHHVESLLEARDLMAYPKNVIAPAHGLFLKEVEYCEDDLEMGATEEEQSGWMEQGPLEDC
ncbi:tRNA pseudouridine synthase-like 1 [Heteronotia binoei]|uniref:tRNA pseudouridine synthase-like 1 n=1 Tax=Heteronotia binoei TaxID=13085 RepID=UPI00292EEA1C|nr:tRNA pseudouridine synthase-like 1 [Heteronotia binoei]